MSPKEYKLKVLFIGKANDSYSSTAASFIQEHFEDPVIIFSRREDPFPAALHNWKGDLLISYLAQWIIPAGLLDNARMAAINFHPGPPEYPGIGCTNFAMYNGEKEFGITCHHMMPKVDTGAIIAVRRFPVMAEDSVFSVTQRCYKEILLLFYDLMQEVLATGALPVSKETWQRIPYTRKQLNELCVITPDMDPTEVQRRLKATTFGDKVWAEVKAGNDKIPYETARKQGIIA